MRIGIYDKEIFIENGLNYDVLRFVDKETLDRLHTVEGLIDYGYDELWKEAVVHDATTDSLNDWLEQLLCEEDDGDEEFVGKDSSFLSTLTKKERKAADKFILDTYGIEVGTWECSGLYPPEGEFDFILRTK